MPGRMRDPGPRVKDAQLGEAVRGEVGRRGGTSGVYEDWTVDDLRRRAAEIGIAGRSRMRKDELIDALRSR